MDTIAVETKNSKAHATEPEIDIYLKLKYYFFFYSAIFTQFSLHMQTQKQITGVHGFTNELRNLLGSSAM